MLELTKVHAIKGTVVIPSNPDLCILTWLLTLAMDNKVSVSSIDRTPYLIQWEKYLSAYLDFQYDENTYVITTHYRKYESPVLTLPINEIPYRDFVVSFLLGAGFTISAPKIPDLLLELWKQKVQQFGCDIETREYEKEQEKVITLSLSSCGMFRVPSVAIEQNVIHTGLGLALGLKQKTHFIINYQFQSPLRHILPAMGYELAVKSNMEPKNIDPLERRMRFMVPRSKKKTEANYSFTIAVDFSSCKSRDVSVTLGGDDLLSSLLLCAKSLVQKGNLILDNVALEPWCCATLHHIRRMGCKVGIQENKKTTYGTAGTVSLQRYELSGRKVDCTPLFHYRRHLPTLLLLALFSRGQTVFKGLEELRCDEPDPLDQLTASVTLLGGRSGVMPDGFVVEGLTEYDGFDMTETVPAAIAGIYAIAGLKCGGKTVIEEYSILNRWPHFKELLNHISEQKS